MKSSIFLRIFAGYVIVIIAMMGLTSLLTFRTVRNHHLDMQRASLRYIAMGLEPTFSRALNGTRTDTLDSLARRLGSDTNSRITIIDPAGVVLADSWRDPAEMDNHRTRPEIMTALRGETGTSLRFSTTAGEEVLYAAVPLRTGTGIGGVLRVGLSLRSIDAALAGLRNDMIAIASVVMVLALLGALVFSRGLSRPIQELTRASRRVASGDFDTRVLLKGGGEIRELADSFNYMTDRIKSLFEELSQKGEELSGIVASIQDGLLVLDRDGRIVLSNESFRRMVGLSTADGKSYWEVMRVTELDDLVRAVTEQRANQVKEVPFNERIYLCSGDYLTSRDGIVILIHDITGMKSVEKVKKDFVVNLSHELRTPLTAIKGFLETLQDEVTVEGRYYLNIVSRHTDRLADIVGDLLVLSELEDSGTRLEIEQVDLKKLVDDVMRIFEPRFREKGLEVALDAPDGGPLISGDPFKLEQVVINLIANAVKYTEKGGIKISLREEASSAVLAVQDTGVGIPDEHISRIFERFYVVDKSRSKRVGGTGLGLSIVKHIVLLHNGSIDVASKTGEGTTFTVTLPLRQS